MEKDFRLAELRNDKLVKQIQRDAKLSFLIFLRKPAIHEELVLRENFGSELAKSNRGRFSAL